MRQLPITMLIISALFLAPQVSSAAKNLPAAGVTVVSDASDDSSTIPAETVKRDVINRFDEVYKQKKLQVDRLQIDLAAAKDDLAACNKLTANAKTKCVSEANNHINLLTERISNLNNDMKIIQKEIKEIGQ